MIAAPIAFLVAVCIAMFMEKKKWQECLDAAMGSVSNILVALFILMLAYVMANCFMSFGVGASVVNIALKLGVTAKTVACVGLRRVLVYFLLLLVHPGVHSLLVHRFSSG